MNMMEKIEKLYEVVFNGKEKVELSEISPRMMNRIISAVKIASAADNGYPERNANMFIDYCGLGDESVEPYSYKEIAKKYKVATSSAKQVIEKVCRKLRKCRYLLPILSEEEVNIAKEREVELKKQIGKLQSELNWLSSRLYGDSVTLDSLIPLGLSTRAYTGLYRAGYRYVGEIQDLSRDELLKIRRLGTQTVDELLVVLQKLGE